LIKSIEFVGVYLKKWLGKGRKLSTCRWGNRKSLGDALSGYKFYPIWIQNECIAVWRWHNYANSENFAQAKLSQFAN
jgi:hypothetical protein